MKQDIVKKAERLLKEGYICDNCLGRQFAQLLSGMENKERGRIIRNFIAICLESGEELDVDEPNFNNFKFRFKNIEKGKEKSCIICNDIFENVEKYVKKAAKKMEKLEFNNFLVGTQLSGKLVEKEEEIWEKVGINWCEPIKSEINRLVGKELEKKFKKPVEFENPEILVLIDLEKEKINLNINSFYLYGEYNKLKRGIPQTKWPSGKYKNSVEQVIAKPLMKQIGGSGHKFHGCGREDIDAKCLGWRPFIIEILEPKRRKINKKKLREDVKKTKKVEIRKLKIVKKGLVEILKRKRPDKTYRALVTLKKNVEKDDLKRLSILKGKKIYQETPRRVLHRRTDKLRKRIVKDIKWKKISKRKIELKIRAEAGTYIKELVSGDKGRTYPSVSEILRTDAVVKELDVIKIQK